MTTIDVLTSGIWQTTSTVVARNGRCVVVDPAYFPRELDAIAACAATRGGVAAVIFTHGHWDHVMGHTVFPGAPVWLSRTLDRSIAGNDPRATKYLDDARDFDSRWYVPRPHGHVWPTARRGLADGERIELDGLVLDVLQLAGHSPDGLGIVVDGTLVCGDHLSPCEIPFVDDAPAYRATLVRLIGLLPDLREVVPGHGPRMRAGDALAIARADLVYLDGLLAAAAGNDRAAALALPWPRATDVVGMRDHHLENVAAVGL